MNATRTRKAAESHRAPALRERVRRARALLATAEAELERALARVDSAPRAAKVMIGEPLETAVSRLKDAQLALRELERDASRSE